MRTITVNVVYPKGDKGDPSVLTFTLKGEVDGLHNLPVSGESGDAWYVLDACGTGCNRWYVWTTEDEWMGMAQWTFNPRLWTEEDGVLIPDERYELKADILTGELSGGIFQP